MVFDRLILENVGVYAGRNVVELTPPSSNKPVILIGGLNGGGKTTLLESIHLGFYGRNATWSHRGKKSYRDYLRDLITRGSDPLAGARIGIHFHRMVEGKSENYVLTRSWHVSDGQIVETVEVERNGELDLTLSKHWEEYIEGYLPAKLATLFFFDGEQIKELADRESAARILSTAVQSLLGLDVVSRLEDDLSVLERRKKVAAKSDEERQRIEKLREEFEAAERQTAVIRNEGQALNTDLLRLQGELRDWRKRYRKEGGELYDQRDSLEAERRSLEEEIRSAQAVLVDLAAGAAPLLLLEKQVMDVEAQAEKELEIRHERIIADAEKTRDIRILKELAAKVNAKTLEIIEDALEKCRPKRSDNSAHLFLQPTEEFPEELRTLLKNSLPAIRSEMRTLEARNTALREAHARCEKQLSAVPDADALAAILKQISIREAQIRDGEAKLTLQTERLRQAEAEELSRKTDLDRALGGVAEELEAIERDERILTRIPRVKDTLARFRTKVVARHAAKLEHLILESFHQLLRKEDLVKSLRINPNTFDLELVGMDDESLPFEQLSAGERQILATAILWGLAKASGRPLPTIIDTPLGRLDSSHRRHLVQRYFPKVSHQVILLSTDEEIDERYGGMLRPHIGRTYQLKFNSKKRTAQIEEGYFFDHETTR